MYPISKAICRWAVPLLFIGLAGCSPGINKVTGTLKHRGQPVPNALVHFVPESGRPSTGETDEQGRFTLVYDAKTQGAVTGKHKVVVIKKATTTAEKEAEMMGKKTPMSADLASFFDRYSPAKSTYEVTIDRNNMDINLDLD